MSTNDDIMRALGNIEGKVDGLEQHWKDVKHDAEVKDKQVELDHQKVLARINRIENKQSWFTGLVTVSVGVASFLGINFFVGN